MQMQFENKGWVVYPTFIGHMVVWNYEKGVPFEKRWETRGWMTGGSSLEKLAMSITGKGLSFLTLCTYILYSMVGKERKKAIQAYTYRKRTETCRQYIFGSHMICFSLPSCQILVLADFPPFDEWSYNCDMPDIIDKWTNQRVVRWPFRLRLWQK